MKASVKRFIVPVLVIALIFSCFLTGCDTKESKDTAKQPGKTETAKDNGKAAEKEEKSVEAVELSLFLNHPSYWVDSFGGRPVDDEITRITGVTLKVIKAADKNQLAVMIASGDLTDLVYTSKLHEQLSKPSICYSWNELIEKHVPDFKIPDIEIGNSTAPDGNVYTVRNAYSTPEEIMSNPRALPSPGMPAVSVRTDILEKLGNPSIDNLDDLEKILGMVKEKFPDMHPIVINDYSYFYKQLGMGEVRTRIHERDGKLNHHISDPVLRDALKLLNRWYQKGYILAESLIYEYEQWLGTVNSGKAFSWVRTVSEADQANNNFKQAGMDARAKLITKMLSDKAVLTDDGIGWCGIFITKNCKKPDRAIQFMQFMRSKEGQNLACMGIEGEHYAVNAEGFPELTPKMAELKKDYNKMVREVGVNAWSFGVSAVTEGVWNYNPNQPEMTEALMNWKNVQVFKPALYFAKPSADIEETTIYNNLKQFLQDEPMKVIAAESDEEFTKLYNDMIKKAEDMGLRKLEKWMNEKYQEVLKNYK